MVCGELVSVTEYAVDYSYILTGTGDGKTYPEIPPGPLRIVSNEAIEDAPYSAAIIHRLLIDALEQCD